MHSSYFHSRTSLLPVQTVLTQQLSCYQYFDGCRFFQLSSAPSVHKESYDNMQWLEYDYENHFFIVRSEYRMLKKICGEVSSDKHVIKFIYPSLTVLSIQGLI